MLPGEYREPAPAKVNLGLAVLTRRGDGFHEIETLFARTALHDDVVVTLQPEGPAGVAPVTLRTGSEGQLPGVDQLVSGTDNLMTRAAEAYLSAFAEARSQETGVEPAGRLPSVSLELVKRVPVAAGLGGGSSDAAAVLRALNRADSANSAAGQPVVDAAKLTQLALTLGSDVPFFLTGWPAALARGRGERLTPTDLPRLDLVLVNPGIPISAGQAYADLVGFTPRLRTERALERLAAGLEPGWSNGLQPGVLRAQPALREVLTALREAGLKGVLMSGSGSTCFGLAQGAEAAAAIAAGLQEEHPTWWVMATHTVAA